MLFFCKFQLMQKRILALLLLIPFVAAKAQTPTWATDIAPIIYNKCASCHHNGAIAPFSLMTYNACVTHADSIKWTTQNKVMPPWPPDPNYSRLAHERRLTDAEINKIKNWVDGGTPSGDLATAPPPPVFNINGDLPGNADLTVQIPAFTSTASTSDVYQCFVIPSGLLTDKFITAFEAVPGNRSMVHHVLVYADTTGTCASLDAASPGPGYVNFGGVGTNSAILLGGWVPGSAPIQYPNNFGVRIPHNADIVLQIHYPAGTAGLVDSTKVRFFFAANTVRDVYIAPALNHLDPSVLSPYPLSIPANDTASFKETYVMPGVDFSLLGVAPHMHLIGQNIKAFAVDATNDTSKIISIPKWDFHWQGFYLLPRIMRLRANSHVYASAFYDNTTNNDDNPNSPPQVVNAGESTTDEMMLVYFVFALYQPGDENIIIDSAVALHTPDYYHGQTLFTPYPNPALGQVIVKYYFDKDDAATSLALLDMSGKIVKQLSGARKVNSGYHAETYLLSDLPPGVYTIQLRSSERILTQKLIIQH
jgi:mono/diheme cytochrome c family protein